MNFFFLFCFPYKNNLWYIQYKHWSRAFCKKNRDHTRQSKQNYLYAWRRLGAARAFVQSDQNWLFIKKLISRTQIATLCPHQRLIRLDICLDRFSLRWAHTLCCFPHRVAQINKDQATDLVYWSFNLSKSFSPEGAMASYNGAGSTYSSAILIFLMYFCSHKLS